MFIFSIFENTDIQVASMESQQFYTITYNHTERCNLQSYHSSHILRRIHMEFVQL